MIIIKPRRDFFAGGLPSPSGDSETWPGPRSSFDAVTFFPLIPIPIGRFNHRRRAVLGEVGPKLLIIRWGPAVGDQFEKAAARP
jgi:hypothetical protein